MLTRMSDAENMSKSTLYALLRQFVKFGIVGISNNIVSLGIYYIAVAVNANLYMAGYVVGFVAGVLNSYIWNSKYVFRKAANVKSLIKTFVCYGATLLLGSVFLFVMIDLFDISTFIAPIFVIVLMLPLNFLLNKIWTFR